MSARELITDHLDLWTGAITTRSTAGRGRHGKIELNGIIKLRELVLNLGFSGLLTGDTPKAWESVTLGDIGKWGSGGTPTKSRREYYGGDIPWLVIGDLNDGVVRDAESCISEEGLKNSSAKLVPPGTLLIAMYGSIGKLGITGIRCATNQAIAHCMPDKTKIDLRFLFFFILGKRESLLDMGQGLAQQNISQKILKSVRIDIPPLEVQRRIVEKIDELMALCDRLEQQVGDQLEAHEVLVDTLLDALTRSADATEVAENWARIAEHFDTLFTTEASIDKLKLAILDLAADGKMIAFHEENRPLKSMLSFGPRNGFSPRESSSYTGLKVLKLGATTKGYLDLAESKNAEISEPGSSHLWLKSGDILIQRGNAASHVGCNVLVEEDQPTFIYPDLMMKIRVKEEADPKFISAYLTAPKSRKFMWERMTGTSGTMPKISKKVVEAIPIALPNLEIQKATVDKIDELMALCDQLKARLVEAGETRTQLAEAVVEQAIH